MELEFILTVIFILVAVNLIGLGFFAANKNEVNTPIDFFRIKVYQAKVCMSCDNIFHNSEQLCPLCFEKESFPLRVAFPPLSSQKIKEVNAHGYTLQMVGKAKFGFGPESNFDADKFAKYSDPKFGFPQTNQPSRFAPDYCPEPPTTRVSETSDNSGVKLESKSSFLKRSNWIYAGYAQFLQIFKGATV